MCANTLTRTQKPHTIHLFYFYMYKYIHIISRVELSLLSPFLAVSVRATCNYNMCICFLFYYEWGYAITSMCPCPWALNLCIELNIEIERERAHTWNNWVWMFVSRNIVNLLHANIFTLSLSSSRASAHYFLSFDLSYDFIVCCFFSVTFLFFAFEIHRNKYFISSLPT